MYFSSEGYTDEKGEFKSKTIIRTKPSQYYEAGDKTTLLPETIVCDETMAEAYKTLKSVFAKGGK